MRYLVIGCGYIGKPLSLELRRRGHEVVVLRQSRVRDEELAAGGVQVSFGDIGNPATFSRLERGFDRVVNCAASGGGGIQAYRHVYLQGNRNLVAWLAESPPAKLVYTGSTGVYGQDDGSLVEEDSPTNPTSKSGKILVQAEAELTSAFRRSGFPAVILRLSGIYGPGRCHLLHRFLNGGPHPAFHDSGHMNMIHQDDVLGAVIHATEFAAPGRIYNVSDDEPVRRKDFFTWLAGRLHRTLPPPPSPETATGPYRRATDKRISNRRLRQELGYHCRYPTFREGYESLIPAVQTE